ncbi:uncharacterized protein LOC123257010 [Drosophila ananassae]|uniref:uncharacterized protein LOC123257010 n=1 Tax=Drosophila ananassae TaxID=7217 RepID=UPI001CFF5653|nr:uncharacterized protein LOC123257010 [Drosophila ananassae]
MLDRRLSFREHLEYAHKRASETTRALSRMLLNIRGPRQERRKLITSVVSSQILYAAPVWADAITVRSYARGIEADYRLCALRTSCAFRTVSDDAALVIAGLIPLGELVRERAELAETAQDETAPALIPDVGVWTGRKHGEVDFYLTQALSGHGCFRSYLKRFGHECEDGCPSFGRGVMEDAYHVLEESLEETFSPESMVPLMLESGHKWEATAKFVAKVLKELRALERQPPKWKSKVLPKHDTNAAQYSIPDHK